MEMNARQRVVRDLESAANHISEVPRRELEILLRQAALLLRNIPEPLGEEWIDALRIKTMTPARLEKFLPYHQVRTRFLGGSHADDA
jgi:hypothetical protein